MYVELATSLWGCFCIIEDIDIMIELTFVAVVGVVLLCKQKYWSTYLQISLYQHCKESNGCTFIHNQEMGGGLPGRKQVRVFLRCTEN